MFQLSCFSVDDPFKKIKKISTCKATRTNEIVVYILKQNADNFSDCICNFSIFYVNEGKVPNIPKKGNIAAAFRKGYRGVKENYCPVCILPVIANTFEKIFCTQVTNLVYGWISFETLVWLLAMWGKCK